MNKSLIIRIALALILPIAARAQVIGLSLPDTTVVRGTVVDIPVRAVSSLTGANVTSLQLEIRYTPSILIFDSLYRQGTLIQTAGFIVDVNRPESNIIRIAAAGTTPLSGSGTLMFLRFHTVQSGGSELSFTDTTHNYLNQHYPPVSLDDGSFYANDPPNLGLNPDEGTLAVGEQLQFNVYSGTPPYTWSVTNPAVASVNSTGLLTALARGFTRIVVHDSQGIYDTTSSAFEVRALGIGIRDTTVYVGHTLDLPVNYSNLSGVDILSGKMTLTFNGDVVTPVEVVTTGTLLASYEPPVINTTVKGKISIAFAGNAPLATTGILAYVRFAVSSNAGGTGLTFEDVAFNENLPAKTVNASINAQALNPLYLNPTNGKFVIRDTLTFSAWNGTPPYTWSTTDTNVAQIDQNGYMIARARGTFKVVVHDVLGAVGMTDAMTVYDIWVMIGEHQVAPGGTVDVPIIAERIPPGNSVSALHIILTYDTLVVQPTEVVVYPGSLTDGWSFSKNISRNTINIAAAGSQGFGTSGSGLLMGIRFLQTNSLPPSGTRVGVHFQTLVFNEGVPTVRADDGTIIVVTPPDPPYLATPYDGATDQASIVTLQWSASNTALNYNVQVANDLAFTQLFVNDTLVMQTSRQVGPLGADTYYWRVRAVNVAGKGGWSTQWNFTVGAPPTVPAAPTLMYPSNGSTVSAETVTLEWNDSPTANQYHVQVATDAGFTEIVVNDTVAGATSFGVGPLTSNTYYWHVRGINVTGAGDFSSYWSFIVSLGGTGNGRDALPREYALEQNFPNPFNPSTLIRYAIPRRSAVVVDVYDVLGHRIARLAEGIAEPGYHQREWHAVGPTGVYLCRIEAVPLEKGGKRFVGVKKMLMIK